MIKGLIFDFDGLVLDTETPDYLAWQKIYQSYDLNLDFYDWAMGVGASMGTIDLVSLLERNLDVHLDKDMIRKFQKSTSLDLILGQEIMPGIEHLIEESKMAGMRLAIASSSDIKWVKYHLDKLGLTNNFDQICTIENVNFGKPDPALYLHTLQLLNLQPYEVISFEDSPNGIKAAKAANIFCIAVANTMTRQMDLSQADIIYTSLKGVNLRDLLILPNLGIID